MEGGSGVVRMKCTHSSSRLLQKEVSRSSNVDFQTFPSASPGYKMRPKTCSVALNELHLIQIDSILAQLNQVPKIITLRDLDCVSLSLAAAVNLTLSPAWQSLHEYKAMADKLQRDTFESEYSIFMDTPKFSLWS